MEIKEVNPQTIMAYMREEKNFLLSIGVNYSHGLLDVPANEFACLKIYALYVNESIVGFCLIPSFDETLLMRLYVSHLKRSKGYGSFIINHFPKIRHLSCLAENTSAQRFYLNNGFTVAKQSKLTVIFEK